MVVQQKCCEASPSSWKIKDKKIRRKHGGLALQNQKKPVEGNAEPLQEGNEGEKKKYRQQQDQKIADQNMNHLLFVRDPNLCYFALVVNHERYFANR